jgi:peroxiredoxin
MKKNWLFLILPVLMIACDTSTVKEKPFTLQGEVTSYESGWVHMLKREQGQFITIDSTMVDNGVFVFEGKIDHPRFTYLKLEGQQNYITFFLEPGEIALEVSADNPGEPVISGSQSHAVYQAFVEDSKHYDKKMSDLYAEYLEAQKEGNDALMAEIDQQYNELDSDRKDYIVRYINNNSGSPVAAFIALRNLYQLDLDELEKMATGFDPDIRTSSYVADLNQRIDRLRNVQVGKPSPDFIMNDTTGNPVALSSFYGNYLMVDFWASWCGPCRRENPNKVAAFKKYHDQGLDLLGVSLDTDPDRWMQAIHSDGLTWNHLSDLAGWGNEAAGLYAVNSIPSNVLLDPNGVIIARNLKGEDLQKKLEEIFTADQIGE